MSSPEAGTATAWRGDPPSVVVGKKGAVYAGVGTVKALDPKAPSIEIAHGDIEGLMPAMQMEFAVSDAALLNGLKVNDQIDLRSRTARAS